MLFYVCFSFENILRIESDKVNNKNVSCTPSLPQKAVGVTSDSVLVMKSWDTGLQHFVSTFSLY